MKGLLLKDIYNLSGQFKIYALYPLLAAFLSYQQGSLEIIAMTSSFLSLFVIMSACAYDEMANFDTYALTLPLTRKDLVLSKYQLTFIVIILNAVISLITGYIMLYVFPSRYIDADLHIMLIEVFVIALVMNILINILLPLIFKFGQEKARVLLMIIFLSFGVAIYFLATLDLNFQSELISFIEQYGLFILAGFTILFEGISIVLSNHYMKQKNL